EGHEDQTPPEVYAIRPDGGAPDTPAWTVRAVPNRYPAVDSAAEEPERHAQPDLFTAQPATGHHEVIVNAPEPACTLAQLPTAQVAQAVDAWRERLRAHAGAHCRHLIVNEPPEA